MMMIMKMMMMRATIVAIQRCCSNLFSESSSSEINPKPLDSPDLPPPRYRMQLYGEIDSCMFLHF